jgi:hypothetical protein
MVHNRRVISDELSEQRHALLAFLASDAARNQAAAALRRRKLPDNTLMATDVVQAAIANVLPTFRDGAEPRPEPFVAAAYGTRVLQNTVTSLLTGRVRTTPWPEHEPFRFATPQAPTSGISEQDFANLVRLGLEEHACAPAWIVSAAFSFVTLAAHPEAMASFSDAPSPRAGADEHQQLWWPSLWLAGLSELVAHDADRNQQRQRQRSAEKGIELCRKAAASAHAAHAREVGAHG